VFSDGHVENRVFVPPEGHDAQRDAGSREFLNARLVGQTVSSLRTLMAQEIETRRREIDALANSLIESGLAVWENAGQQTERLIVRGRSNLLNEAAEAEELDRIRQLFDDLERKRDIAEFLELTETGEGVRIFHRLGEQVILTFGFQSGRVSIYER
jgi:heat-inducible transcriptional repressor